jgi:hypothetical protein
MTTLPTSLVRFKGELEAAIGREQQLRRRSRRPLILRIAVAAGAATALAVGAFTALPGDPGRGLVEPASAAQRAAAALAATPGSIVHVDMVVAQRNPDGSRTTWRAESWQQTAPPYDVRQIVTGGTGEAVETAAVGGNHQLYDPQTNTVHIAPAGSATGTPRSATPQPATAEPLRDQVLDLLRSGKLTESGRSVSGGRQTISFVWNDGHTRYEYTVEVGTYDPVRWRFSSTEGKSETTITFNAYEVLPADQAPLDLTRQHPDATVQRQP